MVWWLLNSDSRTADMGWLGFDLIQLSESGLGLIILGSGLDSSAPGLQTCKAWWQMHTKRSRQGGVEEHWVSIHQSVRLLVVISGFSHNNIKRISWVT